MHTRKNLFSILTCSMLLLIISCKGQTSPVNKTKVPASVTPSENPKLKRNSGQTFGNIICELVDLEGNIWFSAAGDGLYKFDGTSFINYTVNEGLLSNDAGAMAQTSVGDILVGTKKGICVAHRTNGSILKFKPYFNTDSFNIQNITDLLEDRHGDLWFSSMNGGVYRYDPREKKMKHFLGADGKSYNLGNNYQLILNILQDQKGNLWFTSWNGGGAWSCDADGNNFQNFHPSADYYASNEDERKHMSFLPAKKYVPTENYISDDMIFSAADDSKGNIWFATRRHGACRFDGKKFEDFDEQDGFVSYGIYDILEDRRGNIWFTTEKNGVYCYDGKQFRNFTTEDGLVNNSVFSVLEDKDGNLWFGTRGFGLSKYDGKRFSTISE